MQAAQKRWMRLQASSSAEVAVDLPDPQAKGIHMSRLYLLLDTFAARSRLTPAAVHELLRQMRESHADCGSRAALLRLDFALLQQRSALVTPALAGSTFGLAVIATFVSGLYPAWKASRLVIVDALRHNR